MYAQSTNQIGATSTDERSALYQMLDRLETLRSEAVGVTGRLAAIGDRLNGGVPRGVENTKDSPKCSGAIGQFDDLLNDLGEVLQAARNELDGIERAV